MSTIYFVLFFFLACVFELMSLPNNLSGQAILWTPHWLLILLWVNALGNSSQAFFYLAWGLGLLVDALLDQVLGTNAFIFSLVVLIGQSVSRRWAIYSRTQTTIIVFFGLCLVNTVQQLYLEFFDKAAWTFESILRAFTSALVWIAYELVKDRSYLRKWGADN